MAITTALGRQHWRGVTRCTGGSSEPATANAVGKMVSLTEAMATFGPDDLGDHPGGSA